MKKAELLKKSIALLEQLVSYDTTSRESNLALIEHIASYLENHGIDSRLTHNADKSKANLWATIGPDIAGGIVLSGHVDVVPVDGQNWSQNPFAMWQNDGLLYGRGVVDMKGFVAACLALAPVLLQRKLTIPIHFAFSYDEEVGCIGVRGLIDDVVDNLPMPRAVIVGEPTMMKIIGGHKGSRTLKTVVRGVPAHSSDPRLGANSIMAAARIINFLEDLQKELVTNADENSLFDPPYTTVDLGLIDGGTAGNIIPEFTNFQWGFRELPADDCDELEQRVRDFIDEQVIPDLKKVSASAGVSTEKYNEVPGLKPDADSAAEQLIRHLSGLNESGTVAFGTEAGLFQKAGIPAVVYGPGSIAQAHQPDEFISIDQLFECVTFLTKLATWAEQQDADRDFFDQPMS